MIDLEILQNAVSNLVAGAIEFTPRVLTTIIILVVGWFISKLFRNLTQRITRRIGLDRAIERTGLADGLKQAQITQSPSDILGQFIFWLVLLNFVLVAFESLGLEAAVTQLQAVIAFLPRLLSALFVFIAGAPIGPVCGAADPSRGGQYGGGVSPGHRSGGADHSFCGNGHCGR